MKYVVTRKPYNRVSTLNDFDRLFENFWNDFPLANNTARFQAFSPNVDIRELDDKYVLEAELPGFSEKDLDVNIEKHVLTISSVEEAEKKEEKKAENKLEEKFLIRERRSRTFRRSFVLPEGVEEEKIAGEFKNGILSLEIPKQPAKQPKRIAVKLAS